MFGNHNQPALVLSDSTHGWTRMKVLMPDNVSTRCHMTSHVGIMRLLLAVVATNNRSSLQKPVLRHVASARHAVQHVQHMWRYGTGTEGCVALHIQHGLRC